MQLGNYEPDEHDGWIAPVDMKHLRHCLHPVVEYQGYIRMG